MLAPRSTEKTKTRSLPLSPHGLDPTQLDHQALTRLSDRVEQRTVGTSRLTLASPLASHVTLTSHMPSLNLSSHICKMRMAIVPTLLNYGTDEGKQKARVKHSTQGSPLLMPHRSTHAEFSFFRLWRGNSPTAPVQCLLDFREDHEILYVVKATKGHPATPPYFREEATRAQRRKRIGLRSHSRSGDALRLVLKFPGSAGRNLC